MDNELLLFDRLEVIKKTINKYGADNFYLSYSGGKDSTAIHYLLDEALPNNNITRVFFNTGIEYQYVVKYVKELASKDNRIVIYNSNVNIQQMLKNDGYPFKSKEHSKKLNDYQCGRIAENIKKYIRNENGFGCPKVLKYQFTEEFKLKISDKCCYRLKKQIAKRFMKEYNKSIAILGLRQAEGGQRANHKGCLVLNGNDLIKFKPLNPMSDEWLKWYIDSRNIKLCELYYEPFNFDRVGCKGCPFVIDLQDELDKLEKFLPAERKQCEIIWNPVYEEYRRTGYRLEDINQYKLF